MSLSLLIAHDCQKISCIKVSPLVPNSSKRMSERKPGDLFAEVSQPVHQLTQTEYFNKSFTV